MANTGSAWLTTITGAFSRLLGLDTLTANASAIAQASQVTALVGAEGGWSDDELNQVRDHDWQIVTMGGRIMRAETAAITCAALLQNRFGDLN